MAQPNYLEEVNRARQQARGGRRRRVDDIVNPMDSAAAMDRLQGVEVSDFSSGGADSPPINLAAALSTGGGGTATKSSPFRTAAGSNASPTTVSQTQCPGGRCNINRGMQFPGTVVMSEPLVTSVSPMPAPVQTTVDVGDPAGLIRQGLETVYGATTSSDPSTRAMTMRAGAMAAEVGASQQLAQAKQRELSILEEGTKSAADLAMRVYEDQSPLRQAEAEQAQELTNAGVGRRRAEMLDAVADRRMTVPDYVTTSLEMHIGRISQRPQDMAAGPGEVDRLRAGYRKQGYGALAAGLITIPQEAKRLQEAGGEVDPNFPRRMMQEGVAAIADSYTKEGLFSRPWSEVQTQMREDILPVLEQGFLQADMKFRDAELQSLDPQQREIQMESLRMNSLMAARAAFEGVSDELYERHTQQERGTYKSSIGYLQNFLKNLDHRERGYKKTFPDRTDADVKRSEVERGGGQNALPGGVAFP